MAENAKPPAVTGDQSTETVNYNHKKILMKKYLFLIIILIAYANSKAQNSNLNIRQKDSVTIGLVVFDGMVLQDFAGPLEVFSKAKELTRGKYKIFTIGISGKAIKSEDNLVVVTPTFTFENMPQPDYLVFPGAAIKTLDTLLAGKIFNDQILKWSKGQKTTIVSVCTGAYLLAGAGILDNKKVTTHFFVFNDFSKMFPKVKMVKNVRFVQDGNIITSSGVTSGIDAAMQVVNIESGAKLVDMISKGMQYNFHEIENFPELYDGVGFDRSKTEH